MTTKYLLLFMLGLCSFCAGAQTTTIGMKELKGLLGSWQGTLTYRDYTTQQPYTLPANLTVSPAANERQLVFAHTYPNEPKANAADTLTLSADGSRLNKGEVKWVTTQPDGSTEVVTEFLGVDGNDNQPALIRHTYLFGQSGFMKRKEVQFVGQKEWILRNEYKYSRKE